MGVLELALEDAKTVPQTFEYKLDNDLLTLADQEEACKDPVSAYWFALDVKGADIIKCQEAACKDPEWAYYFALNVKGADKEKLRKVCKGTKWEF